MNADYRMQTARREPQVRNQNKRNPLPQREDWVRVVSRPPVFGLFPEEIQ